MQAWINGTATSIADDVALDAILDSRPARGVTLASDDGSRTLHINFNGNLADLFWESDVDLLLGWGPVPPGAPGNQVVDDAAYAYDNPWFALPEGAEPFEVTVEQACEAAREFLHTGGRPTTVQWVVKP